jgi:hypothetical protein
LERKVLDVREHAQPVDPVKTAVTLHGVAYSLISLRRPTEAYPFLERAIRWLVAKDKRTELELATVLATMAEAHRFAGDAAGSEPWFERALAILSGYEAERGAQKIDTMLRLADVKSSLGKTAEQRKLLEDALAVVRRNPKLASSEAAVLGPLAEVIANQEGQRAAQQFQKAHGFLYKVRVADRAFASKGTMRHTDENEQVLDAQAVVARARSEFRDCYQRAALANVKTAGTSRVTLKIDANGEVSRAEATSIGLPEQMCECILDVAIGAKFKPPSLGGATIVVPITFKLRDED